MSREEQWFLTLVEYVSVAAAFAVCGWWSQQRFPQGADHKDAVFALPFAALCWLLFSRKVWGILSVALSVPVYLGAWWAAKTLEFGFDVPFGDFYVLPMCVGGFAGGAGLALVFGIVRRPPVSYLESFGASLVGAVAALPFGTWLTVEVLTLNGSKDPHQPARLLYSFAFWQAVVGTYLYAIRARTGRPPETGQHT
ncbi:MAG TPA: hypothetical protein VN893_18110 [Bryobacteraceae bacterium]|nr:hypothetical protein [Bryobacteraceae bacterium]